MKKFLLTLLALVLVSGMVFAQGVQESAAAAVQAEPEVTEVGVVALKGPTAMGMVKLMNDAEQGPVNGNSYTFEILASPTEVTPKLVKGEVDIAAVPANLAAVLYNNTKGGIKVLAINTLGVLYIVEKGESVNSVADLEGKTIYASGKASTPEYALSYILAQSGLTDKVNIEWKSEHAECVAALLNDPNGVAMLPQPFVTTAQVSDPSIRIALDLTAAWNEVSPESGLVTGVVVARSAFVEENKAAVDAFLASYKESTAYTAEDVAGAAELVGKYNIVPAKVAEKALPYCNIVCITGDELKAKLSGYLEVLYNANAASVGGSLPADDFYY